MNIKSLEKMEKIVQSNTSLQWDGWTVLSITKSFKAKTSKHGKYINGNWYLVKRFEPSRNGWNIPESFINAQT